MSAIRCMDADCSCEINPANVGLAWLVGGTFDLLPLPPFTSGQEPGVGRVVQQVRPLAPAEQPGLHDGCAVLPEERLWVGGVGWWSVGMLSFTHAFTHAFERSIHHKCQLLNTPQLRGDSGQRAQPGLMHPVRLHLLHLLQEHLPWHGTVQVPGRCCSPSLVHSSKNPFS